MSNQRLNLKLGENMRASEKNEDDNPRDKVRRATQNLRPYERLAQQVLQEAPAFVFKDDAGGRPKCVLCVSAQTYLRASSKLAVSTETTNKGQPTLCSDNFNAGVESTNPMSTAALGNAKLSEPPTRQPTILVVEHHDDTRDMLHTLLEMWGCRVVEACNGLEAVEAASREKPELILLDARLPFLDGLQATRRIREKGPRDQVKIVVLNGSGNPCFHADALAAGCDDSLEKPFDFDWLRTYLFCSSILPLTPTGKGNYLAS